MYSDEWYTPIDEIDPFVRLFGPKFGDPCGSARGESPVTRAAAWSRTVADGEWDGVTCEWSPEVDWFFVNPPYSSRRAEWVNKCASVGTRKPVVLLLPDATDTAWFRRAYELASMVLLRTGRIAFLNENGARVQGNTRGSTFFVFEPGVSQRRVCFVNELCTWREHGL
jgi:hypothetical protein